ncbi:MAG: Glycosyl transferase family 2 [Candidatus Gottesmanbacteria bacterium GW2011_GWB1_44_11c]|uniref:Glycosyl transferase family 2 n=1 Tax=Candidatus Gottesmanbacteria bacterium GW2011_GWB1_44_11c TaxID=1618447 RepID=A0A0G1GV50_9BACT|nr:MAG: Glycosyl transferase family 2 [Candidatus Gottesmanbacteria bacterium GW2011_GWB1_44_11c]
MKIPRISIITPSFNQRRFIARTIESVCAQDYPNIEYIVMDGGSTDGTVDILKNGKWKMENGKKNILFRWVSEKDNGQADAINTGLRKATGDIVGYLNSDDYYEPGAIRKVMEIFQKDKAVQWLTGDCRIVNEKGNEIERCIRFYKKAWRHIPLQYALPVLNPIAQPSTFWRKRVMDTLGTFKQTLTYAFDYDYWIRLSKQYPLTVLPDTLSCFRIHKKSKGGSDYRLQFEEEMRIAKHHFDNPILLRLHRAHAKLTIWTYNRIK